MLIYFKIQMRRVPLVLQLPLEHPLPHPLRRRRRLQNHHPHHPHPPVMIKPFTVSFYYRWFIFLVFLITHQRFITTSNAQEPEDILDRTTTRPVVVHLPDYGKIQGKRIGGGKIDFFGGLPYAAPPVGQRRWAPPEYPPLPWAPAKLDATQFGPDCWQLEGEFNPGANVSHMSEDCLYLNVYTPAGQSSRSNNLIPVMVWLHGGAFQQGGGRRPEYDGRRLAERGIVVVTINYRLGALGFLVSSRDGVLGNFGLMDQRAALQWVRDNVMRFGGDPDIVTLFGESAGAVMTGLHLLMDGAGKLFHKAILQSNPLGLQFRSVVIADFIGEALKASVDCRDLACLRAERVEEIMRAQSSLMGVPRSVGDFFTWGPTLTHEVRLTLGMGTTTTPAAATSSHSTQTNNHPGSNKNKQKNKPNSYASPFLSSREQNTLFRDLDSYKWQRNDATSSFSNVNVSQPLKNVPQIPNDIPIILGANKHEGEMFVHGAFPITMSKAVYWMFVGALFRDSASRVLKHYRGYVDQIEKEAAALAKQQIEEEENRQYYFEHKEELEDEYQRLLDLKAEQAASSNRLQPLQKKKGIEALFETWTRGGGDGDGDGDMINNYNMMDEDDGSNSFPNNAATVSVPWHRRHVPFLKYNLSDAKVLEKLRRRDERLKARLKEKALKEAAKVVVDYRPVMSRIIDDYLFRCPTWHLAQQLSRDRLYKGQKNNVYVYQFSHSTHIPGYKECWGKSCHTSELPYVFQAMDIIRTNYSTLGPYAQAEAPETPEYPFTDILAAYRAAREAALRVNGSNNYETIVDESSGGGFGNSSLSMGFQRLLYNFFGDYFKEDADEEIASDMADRWVAFARTGDPNYEGSRAEWRPWRYVFDDDVLRDTTKPWEVEDFDQIFLSDDENEGNENNSTSSNPVIEGYLWSEDPQELAFRRRALRALGMEVVEEDVFQTMLLRTPKNVDDTDNPFGFLFGGGSGAANKFGKAGGGPKAKSEEERLTRRAVRQLQQIAQDMGLLGKGLAGEPRRGSSSATNWVEDFFPEILELKWPPEGRLVERDCTCDLWDRIRYRY